MLITIDWLKEKGACAESLLAFKHRFPNGAEYQEVLDALAAEDRYDWGSWLLLLGTFEKIEEKDQKESGNDA